MHHLLELQQPMVSMQLSQCPDSETKQHKHSSMSNYPEDRGIAWKSKGFDTEDPVVFQVCGMCCRGHPESLHVMECFLGNSQITEQLTTSLKEKSSLKTCTLYPQGTAGAGGWDSQFGIDTSLWPQCFPGG